MTDHALPIITNVFEGQGQLHCQYFDAGSCRSCALLETPYAMQLSDKQQRCLSLLPQVSSWLPPFSSGDRGFRNRVKLVVGGVSGSVTLGILGPDGQGVDLRECAIQSPSIAEVIPAIAEFLAATGLAPYNVPARHGELKFVHITAAPGDAQAGSTPLMVRFVVRSEHALEVLRSGLTELRDCVPDAAVISVNLLPEHKAVLEGEHEELLLGTSLSMPLGFDGHPLTLHLMPQSFFQTNTAVARELYAQVASWAVGMRPASVWDLYCGVGGFALHISLALRGALLRECRSTRELDDAAVLGVQSSAVDVAELASGCKVLGVELSEAAIDSARRSSKEAGLLANFVAADATAFALSAVPEAMPELLVVNPPRRGIGSELASWIEGSGIASLVYSSCNAESLAKDLASMPAYRAIEGRVFDMFPHTSHLEVAVLLHRDPSV